jgi:hypothetical protein
VNKLKLKFSSYEQLRKIDCIWYYLSLISDSRLHCKYTEKSDIPEADRSGPIDYLQPSSLASIEQFRISLKLHTQINSVTLLHLLYFLPSFTSF